MNPYQVVWELTLKCNMNCIHCGSSAGKSRIIELITKQALSVIKQLDKIGTETIVFMGGEPFLRQDWYELAKAVNDTNIDLLILSNGYNIKEKTIDKLSKLTITGCGVSIDGGTSVTHDAIRRRKGSFEQSFDYLKKLNEINIPACVVTSVFKQNISELSKLRTLLKGKIYGWQLQMVNPTGRFKKELVLSSQEYYALGKFIDESQKMNLGYDIEGADCCGYFSSRFSNDDWNGCQAGIRILGLRSDGSIFSCLSINRDEYIEGNVKKDSIVKLWNDPNFASFNRHFTVKDLGQNCKTCNYGSVCRGGCSAQSISLYGQPHNDGYCYHLIEKKTKEKINGKV
jgi:radical SAM protein with 4Fe4S-binding SPASM domain